MLSVLHQRNFALLWVGGLISLTGDRALAMALPYYIYQQTGSTLANATLFAAYALPMILFGSVAGVFVDRWDRRRIMVVTSLIQAGVMLLLLLVQSREWLWLVYVVALVATSLAMFFGPAEDALLPNLVDEKDLVAANALNSLNNNIARLAGPPLGGVLVGLFGLNSVAIFDSASFLIAAGLIALVTSPKSTLGKPTEGGVSASTWISVWREWVAGLRLVRRDRAIMALFAVAAITSFGGVMFDPLVAPWVLTVLQGDAVTLGWLSTYGAIGGLLGGLLLGRLGHTLRPVRLFAFGCIVAGLVLLVMYNLTSVPLVLALALLKGVPLVGSNVGLTTLFQINVPDAYRGRVYGAVSTTIAVVGLAGLGLSGALGEMIGIVPMLSVAAGITALAGVLGLVLLPVAAETSPNPQPASQES